MSELVPIEVGNAMHPRRSAVVTTRNSSLPPESDGVEIRTILRILRRRIVLLLTVAVLVFAATFYIVEQQRPRYQARATLRIRDERGALTGGLGAAGGTRLSASNDPLLSELQVLNSRSVAADVVDKTPMRMTPLTEDFSIADLSDATVASVTKPDTITLNFQSSGVTVRGYGQSVTAAYNQPVQLAGVRFVVPSRPDVSEARIAISPRESAIRRVQNRLEAQPRRQTDVVDVSFIADDPAVAQTVLNTSITTFQEASAEAAQQESRRRRTFLETQLRQADSTLAVIQSQLSNFRRTAQLFTTRDRYASEEERLVAAETQRKQLDADRRVIGAVLNNIARSPSSAEAGIQSVMSSPSVTSNQLVAQVFGQLTQLEAKRDSLLASGVATTNPVLGGVRSQITVTQTRLLEALRSHAQGLDARIAILDEVLNRSTADIGALPALEAEEVRLVQQVETATKLADELRSEYQRSRITEAVESGKVEVLDFATFTPKPIGSGKSVKLALGLVLGLLLGAIAAFLREQFNTKLTRVEEIESSLAVPDLAVIPRAQATTGGPTSRFKWLTKSTPSNGRGVADLVTTVSGYSGSAEAYRRLRTNILFSQARGSIRRIMITSAMAGEGKTTTSANLAISFAQQGLRVLLIDADLRRPALHKIFGMHRDIGLADVLVGAATLDQAIQRTTIDNLAIALAGTHTPNPAELLGSDRMRALIEQVSKNVDVVIFDTPPVLLAGEAGVLSTLVDGVVLVVRAGSTDRNAAQAAMHQMRSVGANVIGAVLNDPDAKVKAYDSYGYYQYAYSYFEYGANGSS